MRPQEGAPRLPVALRRRRQPGLGEDVAHRGRRDGDAELAQLADDPHVAPARVLARETHDQLAHLSADRRPAGTAVRIRPAAGDQPPMPAQQRLRPDQEDAPRAARQHPAQRRKQQPVVRLEPRPADLPAQDRQLVPEHENLELLRPITAGRRAPPAPAAGRRRHTAATQAKATSSRRGRRRYRGISRLRPSPDRVSAPHARREASDARPAGAAPQARGARPSSSMSLTSRPRRSRTPKREEQEGEGHTRDLPAPAQTRRDTTIGALQPSSMRRRRQVPEARSPARPRVVTGARCAGSVARWRRVGGGARRACITGCR